MNAVDLKQQKRDLRPPTGSLDPLAGPLGVDNAIHLLKRTMFGATNADIAAFSALTATQAVAALLTPPATMPSPPINNYSNANIVDPGVPLGQTWVNAPRVDANVNGGRRKSLGEWWVGAMLNQNRSLMEKMVLFWHNHFSTQLTNNDSVNGYYHNLTLRKYAFGNFKAFVKAITLDPLMLEFLNGQNNNKTAPDENYGREVQELFTVGKNADGTTPYTEADVKAAARLLTGYQIDYNNHAGIFNPARHDSTDKVFSAFYGNKTITGRTGADGAKELDDFLDMIFATPNVASYICRKIYRFFVYYDVTPAIETAVIQPLATLLRTNSYEIAPVLQTLFSSQHFFDPTNIGVLIKPPMDYTVGMIREMGVSVVDGSNYMGQYDDWNYLYGQMALMNQDLAEPPNVAGWPAYYEAPSYHEIWISTATISARLFFTDNMIATGHSSFSQKIVIDTVAYTKTLPNPSDPNQLITDALQRLYRIPVNADVVTFLKTILLSGQVSDHYWTDAWTLYLQDTTNTANYNTVAFRLKQFYKYIMDQGEYQLS